MASDVGNRVDPFSTPERGYFMGNRDFGDAWIACSRRHSDGSTGPSTVGYFKPLFLDEATALAAGHRHGLQGHVRRAYAEIGPARSDVRKPP